MSRNLDLMGAKGKILNAESQSRSPKSWSMKWCPQLSGLNPQTQVRVRETDVKEAYSFPEEER